MTHGYFGRLVREGVFVPVDNGVYYLDRAVAGTIQGSAADEGNDCHRIGAVARLLDLVARPVKIISAICRCLWSPGLRSDRSLTSLTLSRVIPPHALPPLRATAVGFDGNEFEILCRAGVVERMHALIHVLVSPAIVLAVPQKVAGNPPLGRLHRLAVPGVGSLPHRPEDAAENSASVAASKTRCGHCRAIRSVCRPVPGSLFDQLPSRAASRE